MESSAWALSEVHCVFHRHFRQGSITAEHCLRLSDKFREHVDSGVRNLMPVSEALLMRSALRVASAPAGVFLRAGDAVHLTTAQDMRAPEIRTNDRHMLAAAVYFGLTGRSV